MDTPSTTDTEDDIVCRSSPGNGIDEEIILKKPQLETFIESNEIDLTKTTRVPYKRRNPQAGFIESDIQDSAGNEGQIDKKYPAATDELEVDIKDALISLVENEDDVEFVLKPLKNWKHGSYTIHTSSSVPSSLKDSEANLAHYAQTHELLCKQALSFESAVRNDKLNGKRPSESHIKILQHIHGLSRQFLAEHSDSNPPYELYRGLGSMRFAEVGRQLVDGEGPEIEVDEPATLGNFTLSKEVAASFQGLVLSIAVPPAYIAVAADQLFKCRDPSGKLVNCHAEIRVATDCYEQVTDTEIKLPSGTEAIEFLSDPDGSHEQDNRFMPSLLESWFGDFEDDELDEIEDNDKLPGPKTAKGFDRIEHWYEEYDRAMTEKLRKAAKDEELDDEKRLRDRLAIVTDLKNTAEEVRKQHGI